MKLLVILTVFVVLACTSANTLPAVYDGPIYELSKHTSHQERSRIYIPNSNDSGVPSDNGATLIN